MKQSTRLSEEPQLATDRATDRPMDRHMMYALSGALLLHLGAVQSLSFLSADRMLVHRHVPDTLNIDIIHINVESKAMAGSSKAEAREPHLSSVPSSKGSRRSTSHVHEPFVHADHSERHVSNPDGAGDVTNPDRKPASGPVIHHAPVGPQSSGSGEAHVGTKAHIHCDEDAVQALYPSDAKQAGVAEAMLRMVVTVDESGNFSHSQPLNNPGFGFVRAAQIALKDYCHGVAAKSAAGQPVKSSLEFRFHFIQDE